MSNNIVICGFPRSGSTLLLQMLIYSVKGYSIPDKEINAVEVINSTENYITKSPKDIFNIDNIIKRKPASKDFKIILTTRDVRAIITSTLKEPVGGYYIKYDGTDHKKDNHSTYGIKDYHDAISDIKSRYDVYEVKYEDLVNNTEELQKDLQEVFGFDYINDFKDFYKRPDIKMDFYLSGVREVDPGGVDKWKNHRDRIIEQFNVSPELFDILIDQGYEKDNSWFNNFIGEI